MKAQLLIAFLILISANTYADNSQDIAVQLQNPVAKLVSVPFQFNFENGYGKDDKGDRFLLNVQPVIPSQVSENWNLISRIIAPVISQTDLPTGTQNGIGDISYSGFLSPTKFSTPWIWGVGAIVTFPTATDELLGAKKYTTGPTFVVIRQDRIEGAGTIGYGMLANQSWSIAGDSNRSKVDTTFFQPFLGYTTKTATGISLSADHAIINNLDETLGYGIISVSQVFKIKDQVFSTALGYKQAYAGPEELKFDRGFRFNISFVFPK